MKRLACLTMRETRVLLTSRPALLFFIVLCLIIGYSMRSAVLLYARASAAALDNPLYASGFEPVPGVFIPALGSLFVVLSLFLPFLVMPLLGRETRRNTLVLLLQAPFSPGAVLAAKTVAALALLLGVLLLVVPCPLLWSAMGGHVPWGELALPHLGYLLYGLLVIAISMFSAALFGDTAAAPVCAIGLITVSWVIDFGKDMDISPLVVHLAPWTTTSMLHVFEQGIFSWSATAYFLLAAAALLLLARSLWGPCFSPGWCAAGLALLLAALAAPLLPHHGRDCTESHRNSFPPQVARALRALPAPLEVSIHLRRTDSRFRDYEGDFLRRLRLVRPDVRVILASRPDQDYGRFVYAVGDRSGSTYSNSEEEILPLLFSLAGVEPPSAEDGPPFPGYPLCPGEKQVALISHVYYGILPLILVVLRQGTLWLIKRRYTRCCCES